jgi:hypothetical protein
MQCHFVGAHLMMVEKGSTNQKHLYHEVIFVAPTIVEHPHVRMLMV